MQGWQRCPGRYFLAVNSCSCQMEVPTYCPCSSTFYQMHLPRPATVESQICSLSILFYSSFIKPHCPFPSTHPMQNHSMISYRFQHIEQIFHEKRRKPTSLQGLSIATSPATLRILFSLLLCTLATLAFLPVELDHGCSLFLFPCLELPVPSFPQLSPGLLGFTSIMISRGKSSPELSTSQDEVRLPYSISSSTLYLSLALLGISLNSHGFALLIFLLPTRR